MAIMYALMMLMASGVLLAAARKERAETVFPALLLFVIAVLFPFYCFDQLPLGRALVYVGIILLGAASVCAIVRQKRSLIRSVQEVLTPGIFLFAAYCGFVFLYTRGNFVGLWDELRLWGAVPKALYLTDSLQLGASSLIFPSMQAYPPGMPLLVYFMESLSPAFSEGHIFVVYGIFFGAMLLPALRNLKWRNWPFFLPVLLLFALVPCIFTSHGGDDGWFYESLFIDPILGVLAGYSFYLASDRPFASAFSGCRFGASLLALTIVKDSGVLFAVSAAVLAVVIYATEAKTHRACGRVLSRGGVVMMPILVGYVLWRYVLMSHGLGANEGSFMKWDLSWESIEALWLKLVEMPMLNLSGPILRTQISLTYLPCLLGLLAVFHICRKGAGGEEKRLHRITWITMILSFGIFLIGYRLSFRSSLPSFQRYVSMTLICATAYVILQGIPAVLGHCAEASPRWGWWRKLALMGAAIYLLISGCLFLGQWRAKKYDMTYTVAPTKMAVREILQTMEGNPQNPADVYVLIADKPRQKSLIHHRIYYELLGTGACVRNFWNDVNIVGGEDTPESWTQEEIAAIASSWSEKLKAAGYDCIYVVSLNDFAAAVLMEFGITDAAAGDVYLVSSVDGTLTLEKS